MASTGQKGSDISEWFPRLPQTAPLVLSVNEFKIANFTKMLDLIPKSFPEYIPTCLKALTNYLRHGLFNSFYLPHYPVCICYHFLSKGQWTYGPTFCLSIDTHIRSKRYKVVYF